MFPIPPRPHAARTRSVRSGLGEQRDDSPCGTERTERYTLKALHLSCDPPVTHYTEAAALEIAKARADVKIERCVEILKRSDFPSGSEMRRVIKAMRALKSA